MQTAMTAIDLSNLAVIFVTTEVNKDRIDSDPPELPFEPSDPGMEQDLKSNAKYAAYQYDYYKDVIQCSILHHNVYHHFMYCDDPAVPNRKVDSDWRKVTVVDFEKDLIGLAMQEIGNVFPETNTGVPYGGGILAGWKLPWETWPMMVNKAFAYGCPMPRALMSDPIRRFSTYDCLLDVANIYAQGIAMSMRRLPALADVLGYWGFRNKYATPRDIKAAICHDPIVAAALTEQYMGDMELTINQYYHPLPSVWQQIKTRKGPSYGREEGRQEASHA